MNLGELVERNARMLPAKEALVYVEDAIYEHPDVQEAAIIVIPDLRRGETVRKEIAPFFFPLRKRMKGQG